MKVFYSGVNLYGQYSAVIDDLIVKEFAEVPLDNEELLFYTMSLTFSVLVTRKKVYIRGFFNGRPYQNYDIDFEISTIKQVACNENHILLLTKDAKIWQLPVIGEGKFKPITNFINTEISENTTRVIDTLNDSISKIYCGKTMNLAVSKQGVLYSIPSKIDSDCWVESMACGQEHGIFVTKDGQVYTWGIGTRGQLGHGELEPQPIPRLVQHLDGIKIIKVAAGGWHCAALSEDGDVYTWGWNSNGQLGFYNNEITKDEQLKGEHFDSVSVLATPRVVDIGNNELKVGNIACGIRHTIAFLEDGSLYGTGMNKYYQLGNRVEPVESICQMTLLAKNLGKLDEIDVMCGPYCTAYIMRD